MMLFSAVLGHIQHCTVRCGLPKTLTAPHLNKSVTMQCDAIWSIFIYIKNIYKIYVRYILNILNINYILNIKYNLYINRCGADFVVFGKQKHKSHYIGFCTSTTVSSAATIFCYRFRCGQSLFLYSFNNNTFYICA